MKIKCIINIGLFFFLILISLNTIGQEAGNRGEVPMQEEEPTVSATSIKKWDVKSDAVTFGELLPGTAGVYLLQNGVAGQAPHLMIRGVNTINLNASPYVFVDGVPMKYSRSLSSFLSIYEPSRFNFINPNDIRSIDILKQGNDLSFLGGRGSDGAVFIETDRGELGGTKIDFSARVGWMTANYDVDRMDASLFKNYLRNYLIENGSSESELNSNPVFDPNTPRYNNNTNWLNLITRNANFQDYHLKLKGGDGDACYMFSVGYTKKEETIDKSDLQRVNMRFNLDYKLSQKIEISNNLSYSNTTSTYAEQGFNDAINPIYVAVTKAPFLSPYLYSLTGLLTGQLSDSDELGKSNPLALVNSLKNSNEENRVDGIINAKWRLATGTLLKSAFAFNYFNMKEQQYRPSWGIVDDLNRIRQNFKRNSSEFQIVWNSWLEKDGAFGSSNNYSTKTGFFIESTEEKSIFVRKINAGSDDYETLQEGTVDSTSNINYQSKLIAFYFNGNVDLFDRLALLANINAEGSSNFGKQGRWKIYPGLQGVIDLLERNRNHQISLQAGWGRSGNNDLRGYYHYNLYYPANYYGYGGVYLGNIANENIKPEITDCYDLGVHFDLFGNKLMVDGGYYYKKTSDLIVQRAVPIELGLDPQFENNGKVVSQGVEISLEASLVNRENLNWSVRGNLSTLKNEVKELYNGEIIKMLGNVSTISREGEAIGSFYGYKVRGVFESADDVNLTRPDGSEYKAGDYIIEDINGDHKVNDADRQLIGSSLPDLFGNFGTTIRFKRLSLNALFSYSVGNDIYNSFNQQMHSMKDYSNQSTEVLGRWVSSAQPGDGLSRAAYDDPSGNGSASDLWVEDGSYLRLKNVSLNYTVPTRGKLKFFRELNIYLSGENLLTLTKYSGFDPEVISSSDPMLRGIDFGSSPVPQSYVLGIKMSF
ncbi:SusC/RagA family TonB-linked outer membrane protein [Gaoshiqia sp. Z1-71]|uniref:SusC/RagA family TonB-linked outer membrane protein n=1 Tax=Gaoshiqia hydrogeniformans TaxID=3290090 RepID=UPI003BF7922B